jgi:hypothetical protein
MSAPLTSDPEYLNFLDGQRADYVLREAEINSLYQDHMDGMRDGYLDELEAGE